MTRWHKVALRRLVRVVGGSWGGEPGSAEITVPCIRATDFDYAALRTKPDAAPMRAFVADEFRSRCARQGDLILEKSGGGERQPVGRVVHHADIAPVMPTNFAARLRPEPGMDARFLSYQLSGLYHTGQTMAMIKQTTGIQNLDVDAFLGALLLVPEPTAQSAIADYLDTETARIDVLITKRLRLKETLSERACAVVSTRLGRHEGVRLKHLLQASLAYGVLVPIDDPDGIPMLRITDLRADTVDLDSVARIPRSLSDQYRRTVVAPDDLVVSVVGTLGKFVEITKYLVGANLNRALARVQLQADVPRSLVRLWFESVDFQRQALLATSSDSAQPTLGLGDLKDFAIGIPRDRSQWQELEDMLLHELEPINRATSVADKQTTLLRERRQALITAAVTGQMEIPGAA